MWKKRRVFGDECGTHRASKVNKTFNSLNFNIIRNNPICEGPGTQSGYMITIPQPVFLMESA